MRVGGAGGGLHDGDDLGAAGGEPDPGGVGAAGEGLRDLAGGAGRGGEPDDPLLAAGPVRVGQADDLQAGFGAEPAVAADHRLGGGAEHGRDRGERSPRVELEGVDQKLIDLVQGGHIEHGTAICVKNRRDQPPGWIPGIVMPHAGGMTTVATTTTAAYRWRWVGLVALLVAEAMNLLDATIVQVAAPAIHADLGGSASDIQWFSTAYTMPFALL